MAIPTQKSAEVDALLSAVLGKDRTVTIITDTCGACSGPAKEFKNEISKREYEISALCQKCQDRVWKKK